MIDELWSGVAVCGAPSVEGELGVSHAAYVTLVFAGPLIVAAVLETGIALASDLGGRARLVVVGQGALAVSLFFTAWTTSAWGLTLGLALAGTSSGVACGASQALLVKGEPGASERAMVRWSLFGAVGDVIAPLATAAAIALGHSYRAAMLAVGVAVALQCAVSARALSAQKPGEDGAVASEEETPHEPLRSALRRAARRPALWAWLFAAAACTLLDELVVALATLRLEREQGTPQALAIAAAVTFSAGSVLGAALTDRYGGSVPPRRLLVQSSVACALGLVAFVAARGPVASCALLIVVGVTCAPHHALALARAYDELPDRPGTVQALAQIFVVLDVGAPLALGVVADRFGLVAAIACLVAQPAIILACALLAPGKGRANGV